MLKQNNLIDATVVVTGASSGIGRGTALAFAKEGANLILASRNEVALNEVAEECKKHNVQVLVVPTDVTSAEEVNELAIRACNAFNNRIDVWINDPGVGVVGNFEDIPIESNARVVETNLLGYMNGTYAVLPFMKKQERGVIINMNSLGAFIPSPYAAAYSASKFGVRGFSKAIKAELQHFPDIHMCDVYASFVNSPGQQHGANYTGVEMKPIPPYVSAHKVAANIVAIAKNPVSNKMIGLTARLGRFFGTPLSDYISSFLGFAIERHFVKGKRASITDGNLFMPSASKTNSIEGHFGFKISLINTAMKVGGLLIAGAVINKLLKPKKIISYQGLSH